MNTTLAANFRSPAALAGHHLQARTLLCITVFLLTGIPRMSLKFGPVPLYFIDLFIALSFYYAYKTRVPEQGRRPFTGFILIIAVFAFLGESAAAVYSGDIVRPLYAFARTVLAISLAFSVPRIVRTTEDFLAIIRAAVLGIGLTALLMIFSSLPGTSSILAATVFSISWLEPAGESVISYAQMAGLSARGRSLVGVSILSGAFINAFWPLIALSLRLPSGQKIWRYLTFACCLIAPFGTIMSYSRGAILGLIFVMIGLLFLGSSRSRNGVLFAALLALAIFQTVGWQSEAFYFERVVERTNAMLTDPYKDEREWERIYAYSQPFEHALENPTFILVGEGTSITKTGAATEQAGQATHALFAAAYYAYGMVAAFVYIAMILAIFLYLLREISRSRPPGMISPLFYQALFAGFLGISTWFLFGHAAVSSPRGAMLLFIYIGFISSIREIELWEIRTSFRHLYR